VLAHPVKLTVMRIPAHVPVWLDIVTPSRFLRGIGIRSGGTLARGL
jgi:hypothetical protein